MAEATLVVISGYGDARAPLVQLAVVVVQLQLAVALEQLAVALVQHAVALALAQAQQQLAQVQLAVVVVQLQLAVALVQLAVVVLQQQLAAVVLVIATWTCWRISLHAGIIFEVWTLNLMVTFLIPISFHNPHSQSQPIPASPRAAPGPQPPMHNYR
jgi:hypothetical protein